MRRRPVGAEEAPEQLSQRLVAVDAPVGAEPRLRMDEGDVPAAVGAEDEHARVGGRLQVRAPAAEELLAQVLRCELGQLLARLALRAELGADRRDQLLHLLEREAEPLQPRRPPPLLALRERRRPQRPLGGGQQVECAAHAPRLHELAPFPEALLDMSRRDSPSDLAQIASSAADMTCAWTPATAETTSASRSAGSGSVRW